MVMIDRYIRLSLTSTVAMETHHIVTTMILRDSLIIDWFAPSSLNLWMAIQKSIGPILTRLLALPSLK
jgi:hypothetical protein